MKGVTSRGPEKYGFADLDHWVIGFKGNKLIQWSHQMKVEMRDFYKDEHAGTQVPRQIIMSVKDTDIQGTISCQMKELLESFKMKSEKEGRGYFRFLVECHVQLQIGQESLDEKIEVVNEMMKPS